MKIMVVAYMNPTSSDYPAFLMSHWEKMGHEVLGFPYDLEVGDEPFNRFLCSIESCHMEIAEKRITAACRGFRPDVLLLMYYFMRAKALTRLRDSVDCLVGSYLDNNHLMMGETVPVLSLSDFVIAHDSYVTPLIRGSSHGRNPNVFYMGGCAEPAEHKPIDLSEDDRMRYGHDVSFIGGYGPCRAEALSRLTNYKLGIWGPREEWSRNQALLPFVSAEPVYGLKKTKIYNASRIVMSVEEPEKQLNSVNPRIPETLACGGFVLCNWSKDLEETGLRDGESVAWFRSFEEMEEKVAYYLANPAERSRISRLGREFVLEKMTYQRVAESLSQDIGQLLIAKKSRSA